MKEIIDRLARDGDAADEELRALINESTEEERQALFARARAVRDQHYGRRAFIRGLIEFTNYCKNNCLYCGIRRDNRQAQRYRMTKEEILACCRAGYELGFRTFVLQGGEDPFFTDARMVEIVAAIRARYPDCAITLSLGERSRESYQRLFDAGANRYLLRHETADADHYARLHPSQMVWAQRVRCLEDLKAIGYQTGAGFMVGSPFQDTDCLVKDLRFLQALRPQMVGIGPFIPHHDTPFAAHPAGSAERTLVCLAIVRLMLPRVLLPATTALSTVEADGRIKGMDAGCNVIMPNLSPRDLRGKYLLYDNKAAVGLEAAESVEAIRRSLEAAGYEIAWGRGDYLNGKKG